MLFYYSLISVAETVSYIGTGKDSFRSGKHKQGTSATALCVARHPEGDDEL